MMHMMWRWWGSMLGILVKPSGRQFHCIGVDNISFALCIADQNCKVLQTTNNNEKVGSNRFLRELVPFGLDYLWIHSLVKCPTGKKWKGKTCDNLFKSQKFWESFTWGVQMGRGWGSPVPKRKYIRRPKVFLGTKQIPNRRFPNKKREGETILGRGNPKPSCCILLISSLGGASLWERGFLGQSQGCCFLGGFLGRSQGGSSLWDSRQVFTGWVQGSPAQPQ